jgi:predicted RNA binding protein YcfA (HicA-like mRNA interferase family)
MSNLKSTRKSKDIISVLKKKGFVIEPEKDHHRYYCLLDRNGKKTTIYTYFSHGKKEYNTFLLKQIKKELKFNNNSDFEDFLNCPMSYDMYIEMLNKNQDL